MDRAIEVAVLTHSPSPYQVELFNLLSDRLSGRLTVVYLFERDPSRLWREAPVRHRNFSITGDAGSIDQASEAIMSAELAVMNYYANPFARKLFDPRIQKKQPWVFWGERPGYRLPLFAGRLLRRAILRDLHAGPIPIWGIGSVAVATYRQEFGNRRRYHNIPYFSELGRFEATSRRMCDARTFLFSGSLTRRKGVDLLVNAFACLASEFRDVRLKVMGDGPLLDELKTAAGVMPEHVEFLGFKDWTELPEGYASADVLCVPSQYDGWGLVVPEGLAAGMPVIATDRTGAALEFIEAGRNGWLVRAGDEKSLLSAMREAVQLPAGKLQELVANARSSIKEHSLAKGAERFLAAAREAVSGWQS